MNRDPAEGVTGNLDLSGVTACSQSQTEFRRVLLYGESAAHGARRPVKAGEESIPSVAAVHTAVLRDKPLRVFLVFAQEGCPGAVAGTLELDRGVDDVREEQG